MAKHARNTKIPSRANGRPNFNFEALRELVGDKAFARGEEYFRDGQVQILDLTEQRVLAMVSGNEDYRTEVVGRGQHITGSCTCPAFADRGSCKHMIAAALAASAADDAQTVAGGSPLERIRGYLKGKGID